MPSYDYFRKDNPLKTLRPLDGLLWATAIAALVCLYLWLWRPAGPANELQVMVDNQLVQRLSLAENQQQTIQGVLGDSIIEVREGKARFVQSPCRNQVCVHHGWASHRGDLLACLPNRIALVLAGDAAAPAADIDAINF